MKTSILAGFSILLAMPHSLADESYGQAQCRNQIELQCDIEWDMSSTPRGNYVLEQFDLELRTWREHFALPNSHTGVTDEALPGGTLFRVRGCDTQLRSQGCASSHVVWAPYMARAMDELPDSVVLQNGAQVIIQKNHGLQAASFYYNVVLITKIVNSISPGDVTPMNPPLIRITQNDQPDSEEIDAIGGLTFDIFVHNEVYGIWETVVER